MLWAEKWNTEHKDKPFKYIPGVEAYFHPDLAQWSRDKAAADQATIDKAAAKKLRTKLEILQTKLVVNTDGDDESESIEVSNALTLEDESESKSTKHFNPVNRRHHLVLLPKNPAGLLKIFGLVSQSYLTGFYRFPRLDAKMLREACKEGNIIASSACIAGQPAYSVFQEVQKLKFDDLNQALLDDPTTLEKCITGVGNTYDLMTSVLGEGNYYLELQFNKLPAQNLVNRAIIEFARRAGVTKQLIVTADSHYPRPELWKERELYKKLGWMNAKGIDADSLPKSRDELKCELYPKNASQVWDEYLRSKVGTSFYDDDLVADAIERTHDIAHQVIGPVPPDRSPKFPNERLIPKGTKSFDHLVKLCKEGLTKRGLQDKPAYVERLKEELGVIKAMKNADYFVSYQKIMELARKVVLCGPGRGSGGGSLVAYVLYITDLDPLRWELPFSRFLSIYRKGAPDIDSDLADRDKVLEQLRNFFGFENVVPISNYNTFKLKTLVKDIGKFYSVPFEETNAATRTVEDEVRKATMKESDDKNLFTLTFDDAMLYSPSFKAFIDKYPQVAESIKILFKQNRSLGRHAGGVLITDDLPNKMPLVASHGEPQSPWVEGVGFKHLEYIGAFLKYDLLGLETLRYIERAIELILIKEGNPKPTFPDIKAWYDAHMAPDVIDFNDQKVYEVYAEGKWSGIFQCTGQGAQRLFKKAKPKSIIDIAALTSIYRPGPLAAHVDKLWLEHEHTPYDWGHPLINETLKETRGLLVFQESVMALVNKVAGFPMAETDEVRRAIMKRSISGGEAAKKKVKELEDSIVSGAVKNGVPEATARKMYETICFMSGYGFNRAHACGYSIVSYWCAWMLTHHEEQWLCAYLEAMSTTPDKRAKAFGEVKALGYQIVPIDINHAQLGWTVLPGKKLMPSMTSVKGVGDSAVEEIMSQRPYESIEQMLWNDDGSWRPSKFNRRALEALIKVQALDSVGCIGPDKVFKSYHHMHETLMGEYVETVTRKRKGVEETVEITREHAALIKRSNKGDPHEGRKNFFELARRLADTHGDEWTRKQLAEFKADYFGTVDVMTMFDPKYFEAFTRNGVGPIEDLEVGSTALCWLVTTLSAPKKGGSPVAGVMKKTKNGKAYLQAFVTGQVGKPLRLNVWGKKELLEPYVLYAGEVERNEFGFSTAAFKLRLIAG